MSLSNLPKVIQASTSKVIFFNYPRYPNTCPHIVNELIKLILAKYKELSESHSVVSSSLQPHGLYSPWNFQARILEWVDFPISMRSSQPRD